MREFISLIDDYNLENDAAKYFEMLDWFRKMMLTGGLLLPFVDRGDLNQCFLGLCLSVCFTSVHTYTKPFKAENDNRLKTATDFTIVMAFTVSVVMRMSLSSPEIQQQTASFFEAVDVGLLGATALITIVVIAACVRTLANACRHTKVADCDDKSHRHNPLHADEDSDDETQSADQVKKAFLKAGSGIIDSGDVELADLPVFEQEL